MTGRLVDMAFTLGGKQRVTLELNGDFREIWDKLHLEPILDVEVKSTGRSAATVQTPTSMFWSTRSPPKLANRTTL